MPSGTVKWFNDKKGFGYIDQDASGRTLFVHHTNIVADGFRTLSEGQRVSYEVILGPKGMQASNVQSLPEVATKRESGVDRVKGKDRARKESHNNGPASRAYLAGIGIQEMLSEGNTISQVSGAEVNFTEAQLDSSISPRVSEANNASTMPPRSVKEQSSLGEGAADDHTQQDTNPADGSDTKLFTSVIESERKSNTNTAHAYSAASEYEASELSADAASIFSLPESFSSISSLNDLLGPIEEFAAILIDHAELNVQYQSLRQTFKFSEFKSELHRLLKVFSRDLSKEALVPIEKESVRFVSQQRRRISHAVGQEVFGLKEKSLFGENTKQQQLNAKERIDQFLRDLAQSKEGDDELSRVRRGDNSEDDSSDDEGELGNFPSLEHVKKFLIESKAFEKLRSSVRELVMSQGETRPPRLETTSNEDLKDPESSKTMMFNDNEELHRDDLIKEEHESATLDEDTENQDTRDSSNFTPSLIQITEPRGSQTAIGDGPEGRTHITGMGKIIYRRVSRYLRPKVKSGYRRLEWQCVSTCNV